MALLGKNANKSVQSSNYIGGISRTKCPRHFNFRTTLNAGRLIPLFCDEFNPAETKSVSVGELVRSITPLGPVMDNSFLDIFCFFIPRRLVWDHWEEFIAGYNKEAWAQDVVYEVPKILLPVPAADKDLPSGPNAYVHSFLDYMPGAVDVCSYALGLGQLTGEDSDARAAYDAHINNFNAIDACYPRAYVKVWNDWFRDENLQDEYELYTGDDPEYANAFAFNLLDPNKLPRVAKYHNRFTSALPSPVKGPDVLIPMKNLHVSLTPNANVSPEGFVSVGLKAGSYTAGTPADIFANSNNPAYSNPIVANNVSNTIRMLRLATQTELLLSRDARGGTRYVESLLSHFSVHNGDARLQRSEYLGSRQIPLSMMQITNTSQAGDGVLGNVGAQSVTKDNSHYFTYSATEHGILWIVGCIRTNLSYSSGVRKIYQRFGRFDHIWPEFKHIGDVPLYTKELDTQYLFTGDEKEDFANAVFGYTPYGSELREGYNFNNGLFRAKADGSLAYLTYQEEYQNDETLTLSAEWIEQPDQAITRTLADQNGPQFYALFDIYMEDTIPLDPTSDPGLMDHF